MVFFVASSRRGVVRAGVCASAGAVLLAACGAPLPPNDPPEPEPVVRTTYAFAPIHVEGVPARWGAATAGNIIAGGVDDAMNVTADLVAVTASADGITGTALSALDLPRFCNCALLDPTRHEVLVVGGRDTQFRDNVSAELINTETGVHTPIDHGGAALHPVGCQAFFSTHADRGYIYGGGSESSGAFTSVTYRYDPTSHTITALDTAGPPKRYDASTHEMNDGTILLAGGMGQVINYTFYADLWRFDPATETWTAIPTTTSTVPDGRRYPWTALSPDDSTLLFGFGTDSSRGDHVLNDLWAFHFTDGTFTDGAWQRLESGVDISGSVPAARGFTRSLPGPQDTAGVLAFGTDDALNLFDDAFVLSVPTAQNGVWH